MIELISILFFVYVALKIYISILQIGYIQKEKTQKPVILTPDNYIKAANYAISKERLAILESISEYAIFLFWFGFGLSFLDNLQIANPYLKASIVVLAFFSFNFLVLLPFDIYKSFYLDKYYGFSTITWKIFLADILKSTLLLILFGVPLILALVLFINEFKNWWIYGFLFTFCVVFFINGIFPTIIAPLFNKMVPLDDKELQYEIEKLLKGVGFVSNGIFVADASKRDNRLNAYFGGLGKAKRVVLFDTLLSKLTKNELLAVLAHELGHFKHKDILKNIVIMAFFLLLSFITFGNLPEQLFLELNINKNAEMIICLFLLLSSPLFFFLMPVVSYFSRKFEYAADSFAAKMSDKKEIVSALLKLINENKSFPKNHPLVIFFYHSHPPIIERLKALGYEV